MARAIGTPEKRFLTEGSHVGQKYCDFSIPPYSAIGLELLRGHLLWDECPSKPKSMTTEGCQSLTFLEASYLERRSE